MFSKKGNVREKFEILMKIEQDNERRGRGRLRKHDGWKKMS